MPEFAEGDRVRIDIPDETDPAHEAYHDVHGRVTAILSDDVGEVTGETGDSRLYRIELETGEMMDFRRRDVRPPAHGCRGMVISSRTLITQWESSNSSQGVCFARS